MTPSWTPSLNGGSGNTFRVCVTVGGPDERLFYVNEQPRSRSRRPSPQRPRCGRLARARRPCHRAARRRSGDVPEPASARRAKLGDRPRGRIAGQSGIRAAGREANTAALLRTIVVQFFESFGPKSAGVQLFGRSEALVSLRPRGPPKPPGSTLSVLFLFATGP